MKVALLTPGGVDRSGVDRVIPCILWLIERLVAAGDEVHVFAFYQEPFPGEWTLLGARVHNAGQWPSTLRVAALLAREHRAGRFDVIHALWANSSGVVAAAMSALLRIPYVLTLPGGDVTSLPEIGYGGRQGAQGAMRLRIATGGAGVVTVPSGTMCDQARALGIRPIRLPLGVALDRWPPRAPRRRDTAEPLRLLHVASLNRVKDQETLLQACVRLVAAGLRFELVVIGFDTLDGAVQRRAAELGLGGVIRFQDFVPHEALRPWVEWADVMVVSSLHEAGPLVLLEGAVAGVPTVGTAVGHIADFAPEAAVAVPVGDGAALAAGILRLAADEDERLRVAAAAQRRAIREDADHTARGFRSLYRDVARAGLRRATVSG